MQNIYITTASGEPILSSVTMYPIRLSVIYYKYVVKVKVVIEVTFAFKIFLTGKSLIRSGSENDLIKSCLIKSHRTIPFVAKPLRGKTIMNNDWNSGIKIAPCKIYIN